MQLEIDDAETEREYVPTLHRMHDVDDEAPIMDDHVPALQYMQKAAPCLE